MTTPKPAIDDVLEAARDVARDAVEINADESIVSTDLIERLKAALDRLKRED